MKKQKARPYRPLVAGDLVFRDALGDGARGRVVKAYHQRDNSLIDDGTIYVDVRLDDGTMIIGSPERGWMLWEYLI